MSFVFNTGYMVADASAFHHGVLPYRSFWRLLIKEECASAKCLGIPAVQGGGLCLKKRSMEPPSPGIIREMKTGGCFQPRKN